MSIDKTLKARSSKYGRMEDNAAMTQAFMRIAEASPSWNKWTDMHKECVHMIFHKISRMANGNPMHIDNVHDIGGYAKLLEDFLNEH